MRRYCNGSFSDNNSYCCGPDRGPDPDPDPDRGRGRGRAYCSPSQHDKNRLRFYCYLCPDLCPDRGPDHGDRDYCIHMTYKSLLHCFCCTRYLIRERTRCYRNMTHLTKMYECPKNHHNQCEKAGTKVIMVFL